MRPSENRKTKIAELDNGLEIWKVHLDCLREQDKNARLMDKAKFARLTENIKKDSRLETLPFCCFSGDRIEIISGHHRVRCARAAEIQEIYVLVDSTGLSKSQIISKQLSHNSLSGFDDKRTLKELFDAIETLDLKIDSGILPEDLQETKLQGVKTDAINLDFDFKTIQFVFLPSSYENVLNAFTTTAQMVGISDIKQYEPFVKIMKKTSKAEDIRSIGTILVKICEIVNEYYAKKAEEGKLNDKAEA
jgi:hypothetical protein